MPDKTRTGDTMYVNLTTSFGWWDRFKVLIGCRLRQRVTVETDLPDIGPTTTHTDAEVEPIFRQRPVARLLRAE